MRVAGTARERDLRTLSAAIGLSALGDGVALVARAPGEEPRRRGDGGRGRDRRDVHLPPGTRRPALGVWRAARRPTGTRRLLVVVSDAQAAVAAALALVGS